MPLRRRQKFTELFEKFAITSEVPGGIGPLHLLKHRPRLAELIFGDVRIALDSCGWTYLCADKESFGGIQRRRPFNLAIVRHQLRKHHTRQRRDPGLLGLDKDRFDRNQLVSVERQNDEIAANDLRAVLIPKR